MSSSPERVLSIQSHVVSGFVGNKCAVFTLNTMGIEVWMANSSKHRSCFPSSPTLNHFPFQTPHQQQVDAINSVQFSNHTGYPTFKGQVMTGDQLWDIIQGLQANKLTFGYTHLLTGYIGSVDILNTITRITDLLRQQNPDLVYCCDPVMGDNARLYVSPDIPPAFRRDIVPVATMMTPNQFEAQLLSGMESITTLEDASKACEILHNRGPHTVVISSLDLVNHPNQVVMFASTKIQQEEVGGEERGEQQHHQYWLCVPRVDAYFTGTGDLFSALLCGWLHKYPHNLKEALEHTIAALQAVLVDTVAHCGEEAVSKRRDAEVCRARELRLIQNAAAIRDPTVTHKAQRLYLL
jgi:pyridoxine kinase